MRLDHLTPEALRQAVDLYVDHAWPEEIGAPVKPRYDASELEGAGSLQALLALFDRPADGNGPSLARYTLQLGNARYPFMKLVVQEYLVADEYFLSVDTHDDLDIKADMPDYEEWQRVRAFNRHLKLQIEQAWHDAGLPTHVDLRTLMEEIAVAETAGEQRARLLLVDDERHVAEGLKAVLAARGYDVEVAFDGRQVIERMERDPIPDLVLLDYSMPEFDGAEVLSRVHSDPRCKDVPILLATATQIDLSRMKRACGMLRKPYPREVLFAMIRRILAERRKGD